MNKDSYVFVYNNSFYIFKHTVLEESYINYLNVFVVDNVFFHILVRNRYNNYLSSFNGGYYILMKVRFNSNRMLLLGDIISNKIIRYVDRKNFNWIQLWKSKIDQVELYIYNNEINIYNLSIINYYLGLSESAISYFVNNVRDEFFSITLCHKRIKKNFDLYDYFGITDVVFDHNARDVAEYIKCDIYNEKEINVDTYKELVNYKDKELLVARLIFPTYFFDVIDDFIINNKSFDGFYKYFINNDIYESNLLRIINYITK